MSRSKRLASRVLTVLSSAALAASCLAIVQGDVPVTHAYALEAGQVANPVIWADVPDPDIIRVGDTYYMVSTTMYFSPGVPVMKSKDLVSWEICSYVYDTMADGDKQTLSNGQHDYAHGSWAASLRYHDGNFYVFFGSYGTGKSYIYKTSNIESGNWTKSEINGMYHDASLLFDDDGRNYLVFGGDGNIKIKELNSQMTGFANGATERTIIRTGLDNLAGEGSHIQKINGYYYVFLIAWPSNSGRIELCYRSKSLTGNFEGKTVLNSGLGTYGSGVAQGGIVDTPDGSWYGLLFQDHGSVGRIPVLVPVTWQDGWPMMGVNGKAPVVLDMPGGHAGTQLAKDDEFSYSSNKLALEWQWNHNPDNRYWSVTDRPGWLRLKNGYTAKSIMNARNTLTMRTEGPSCSGVIKMDVSNMKAGDCAGLSAFQYNYGNVGVRVTDSGEKKIYMATNGGYGGNDVLNSYDKIQEEVSLSGNTVYLKTDFQFNTVDSNYNVSNNIDKVNFYYSTDGSSWKKIGTTVGMTYDLKLFTGYRNAIYSYATKSTGGYVDVDYFDYERAEWNAPTIVEPDADGYYIHDTFESGTDGWSGRGGAAAATSSSTKTKGSKSLFLSDRTATWHGGQKSLSTSTFVPGNSYAFSANYVNLTGSDQTEFKLTLQYNIGDDTYYEKVAQGKTKRGQYIQLYNPSYTIPGGASNLVLIVETTDETCDFYVDEVIAAPVGANIEKLSNTAPIEDTSSYLFHDNFETGAGDWSSRGGCTAEISTETKYKGARSMLFSGRTASWNGGQRPLSTSTFVPGKSYAFSACFTNLTGSDPTEFKLTLQYDLNGDTNYAKIAQATANRGDFVQLYNSSFTIPSGAENLVLVAETTEETCDFYLDEVIAAPAGTKIEGPVSVVSHSYGMQGDVDLDGRISVADLVALKKGMKSGFDSEASKSNADIDQSGTVDDTDAQTLAEYLVGKIDKFPTIVVTPEKTPYNYSANLQYKAAPDSYFKQPAKHGTVVKETYTGINGSKSMNVYLPYGYDKSKKYNVFYLMHGGGENENTCFNDSNIDIDIMLDNMIANGDIEPMIVVTPTFNGCPAPDNNMGAGTVWDEMRQSIIPYVEGKYSTYANGNTSISSLKNSRFHRAYGGFSMGGGSTWKMFCNNLDICAYYMPLSGHCWDGAQGIQNAIDKGGYSKSDYFILAATGTGDLAYDNMKPLIASLKNDTKRFTYTSDFSKGNFYFLEAQGNVHYWPQVRHYIYDALPYFFHEGD